MIRRKGQPTIWLLVFITATVILFAVWRSAFPFGERTAAFTDVSMGLVSYAEDHEGWYPAGNVPLEALSKLYPKYAQEDGLAGLSGDREATSLCLRDGLPLTTNTSSWVYIPDFHLKDTPRVGILWERHRGISPTGFRMRHGGRPVFFSDGGAEIVRGENWVDWIKEQEDIRRQVLSNRVAPLQKQQ